MKKLFILIIACLLIAGNLYAANARTGNKGTPDNTLFFEQGFVDVDPGADGYWCEGVSASQLGNDNVEIRFYIKAITGATVTLQWKRATDSTWTDYEDYTEVTRKVIRDNSKDVFWRAGVKDDQQGTSSTFGIDWE